MGENKNYGVAERKCLPFVMLGTQPGLCCTSLQMASSIQMGPLPCYCFASWDLSKDSSPLVPPPTGDSAPPLLSSLRGMGILRAETILASLDLQKQLLAARARVEPVLGRVSGCHWEEAGGIAQDWGGLMGVNRAGKDPVGT